QARARVGRRLWAARTMRRDENVWQLMEWSARRSPLRLGLRGILPPDIKRGAAQVAVFQRGIERILIDNRRPRDIDQQCTWLHQREASGVDQSSRLRCQPAGDEDGVAQRQHAIEFGQRKTVSAGAGL